MMNVRPVVHVVDDDADFRKSVTRLLRLSGYETANYESGGQLLEQLNADTPGCVLLDLDMPQLNGLQLQARLIELAAPLPVVFLSGRGLIPDSVKAIKSGAEDFLCKPVGRQELVGAVQRAIDRNQKMLEERTELQSLRARLATLTPRERQVYALVVSGKLNKQIAHELNTTERTIKAHRHKVMWKLLAHSVVELVSFAERLSILEKAH